MSSYIFKIGQISKYKQLVNKLCKSKHAIILHSDDEILKNAIAKLFVMKNECLSENAPCLICNNCQKVIDENALDVLWFGKDKPVVVGDSENIVQDSYVAKSSKQETLPCSKKTS